MSKIEKIIDVAKTLISFPTISYKSNLKLIDFVSSYLKKNNIHHEVFFNQKRTKANLIATIGPQDKPGIILAGHTDVVPVDNQIWSSDPFLPWIKNDRLYGRGAADMKSFIAIILALIPEMCSADLQLPIHFFLTYDEEIGCQGAKDLVLSFKEKFKHIPLACIVGEPTNLQIINSHKGINILKTIVKGQECHSSDPSDGVSAIKLMNKLMTYLEKITNEFNKRPFINPNSSISYDLTLNFGMIKGGTAINIIPNEAELLWEFRYPPEIEESVFLRKFLDYSDSIIQEEINKSGKQCSITTELISQVAALNKTSNKELCSFVLDFGTTNQITHVNFSTEAGLYQKSINVPTIVCGPGSIQQAHKPNEYIELEQIRQAENFIKTIITKACSSDLILK